MVSPVQVLPDDARERGITDERCFARGREAARALFRAYADELDVDLGFQSFEAELTDLPGAYGPPWGALFLLWDGDEPVACGAIRPLPENRAELKRLYVVPSRRGQGLSRRLLELFMDAARTLGYRRMVLDTLDRLTAANRLYEGAGFADVPNYNANPLPGVRFLGREL